MRPLSILEKIIVWFKSLVIDKKRRENSDKAKRQMCKKAVQSGACPNTCDTCAWNTLRGRK